MKTNVQYGCGMSAPVSWINFDSSPTLRLQKIPLIGKFVANKIQGFTFPANVRYGDIVNGLPVANASCDAIYCSHVLEHLTIEEFRVALQNSYKILKPGGTFRLVMPDLKRLVEAYSNNLQTTPKTAATTFIIDSGMSEIGLRKRGILSSIRRSIGNSLHMSLWDYDSTINELENCGFKEIRKAHFNDSSNTDFIAVESESRFSGSIAIECTRS